MLYVDTVESTGGLFSLFSRTQKWAFDMTMWLCGYVAKTFRGVLLDRITNANKIEATISERYAYI